MFELYTDGARRALFFARYETSALGGSAIETEHLLLGVLRGAERSTTDLFARAEVDLDTLRDEIRSRAPRGSRIPTSAEVPFSPDTKRILESAAAESEGLNHHHIGPEHLILGILRERDTAAGQVLFEKGLEVDTIRRQIAGVAADRTE